MGSVPHSGACKFFWEHPSKLAGAVTEIRTNFHSSSADISRITSVLFPSMECHQEVSLSSRKDPKDQQKRSSSVVKILQPRSCSQPDSLYAYFVCFCGFLSILIAVGCSYSYGLLFPALLDEFKEGKAKTGKVTYFLSGIIVFWPALLGKFSGCRNVGICQSK